MCQQENIYTCSECGRQCEQGMTKSIDGEQLCHQCLYGDIDPVCIWPIGLVKNDKKRRKQGFGVTGDGPSEIRLSPGMAKFMKGLADETHLTIVWQLHKARPTRSTFHRGWDRKEVGPFASRTPDRLTPIAITNVKLLKINGTTLTVSGLDAIDGTPVLDIKVAMKSLSSNSRRETT